jgi:uncharacterized membrane protein YgcG
MRIVRLFGVVLTILTSGLLLAPPAGAQPPSKLLDHVTDNSRVLTASDRAAVNSAIDRLYSDRHIQLWVVYVDNFNRFKPDNWAAKTRDASAMGDHDALLAVATNTRLYTFTVPQGLTAGELNGLQSNKIEPAVDAKDWRGAAVAAADGLNIADGLNKSASSSKHTWLPIAIGVAVVVVVVVVVVVLLLIRARRRRRAAGRVDHRGGQRVDSLEQALFIADARLRQISDYVAKHRETVGAEAKAKLEEAKRHLAAAHGKEASNAAEATAHANGASTLAAQAQTSANADVLTAHRTPRRRGTAATG